VSGLVLDGHGASERNCLLATEYLVEYGCHCRGSSDCEMNVDSGLDDFELN
jgi:hypothetical protein